MSPAERHDRSACPVVAIASGKTTLARAVRSTLARRGILAAAIDLDLVYEVLEGPDARKDDRRTWSRARRLAAALTDALFDEGVVAVVAEGDFLEECARTEFVRALRSERTVAFVTLTVPWGVALARARQDATRGISRDPAFLRRHYAELDDVLRQRPATDLVVDTGTAGVDEAAEAIADWSRAAAARRTG